MEFTTASALPEQCVFHDAMVINDIHVLIHTLLPFMCNRINLNNWRNIYQRIHNKLSHQDIDYTNEMYRSNQMDIKFNFGRVGSARSIFIYIM